MRIRNDSAMFKWFKYGVASVTGILIIVGIIIGIALTIIFNLYIEKQKQMNATISSEDSGESEQQSIEKDSLYEEKDTYVEKGILTLENYQRLQEDMSYEETVKILGTKGRKESVRDNPDTYSVTYKFAERGFKGIDISVSFLNGGLSHKYFYTLVPTKSAVNITAEQFDKVKSGMQYEEVKNILGGEGFLISDSGFPDSDYHSQTYKYNGNAIHSEADFTFNEGELKSKSQNLLE